MRQIVLYIGASYPQRSAVRELVNAGFEVHVTDRDPNPPCAMETPHVHRLDATDVDGALSLAGLIQKRGSLIGAYGIADYAFRSVAAINRLIGGNNSSPDALLKMADKIATKQALKSRDVPMAVTLWSGPASSIDQSSIKAGACGVDLAVVKPASLNGSAGVRTVAINDTQALNSAVIAAGNCGGDILIEEFLSGEVCNFDGLAVDGKVWPISMTYRIADDELPFLPVAQIQPPWDEVPNAAELIAIGQAVSEALGYRNGPFTIDYIRTPAGPYVLEVSPHFHSIALEMYRRNGSPLCAWIRYLAGHQSWHHELERQAERAGALVMLHATSTGILQGVSGEKQLKTAKNCCDYIRYKADGSKIESLSARDALISLGWFAGGKSNKMETFIRSQIGKVQVRVAGTGGAQVKMTARQE